MTKTSIFVKPNHNPQIVDNRKRCPTCNMLEPEHRRWCITAVARGEATVETREIKGQQSLPLIEELPDDE